MYLVLSEQELVIAAQQGELEAYKTLYERYRDRVYTIISYTLTDSFLAEDVLQKVFIKVYQALPNFRFQASFTTWLYRITLNECQAHNQRRSNNYVPLEAVLGSGKEIDIGLLPDEQQVNNQRQEIVTQALMGLSEKLRTVVVLKYVEGLSYEEIAIILNCSPGTVASRLSRALTQLEENLRPLRKLL